MRIGILACLVAVLALAGCGAPESAKKPGAMKAALLVAGPVSDKGWNGLAHDAGVKMSADMGVEVSELQTKSMGEIEAALRDYSARGYDVIFCHGNEYGEPALKVAKDFPKTHYVITAGRVSAPNVTSLMYGIEDAAYLCGMLAAGMSTTGQAACVGGMEIPVIVGTFKGFELGTKARRPDMKVTSAYIGNWDDTGSAKQQTATLINQGNDFILHNADAAGLGVFQAVQEAAKSGKKVYAFGSNADQASLAPDVILASAVLEINKAFETVITEIRENRFQGTKRALDITNGYVTLQINPALKDRIPADLLKQVETARDKMVKRELVVPKTD